MEVQKVLLIDDDANIRCVAEMALRLVGGLDVLLASSGNEALQLLNTSTPDVILLDVMMPGMDGPKTLAKIRELQDRHHIPVIYMTAKVQTHEIEQYLLSDAAGVIAKPFDPMTLADEVRRIVRYAKAKTNVA